METAKNVYGNLVVVTSSYRTYEEWKPQLFHRHRLRILNRSYRTYEEWKQHLQKLRQMQRYGSYRTYEEWKQVKEAQLKLDGVKVLTVPMRNGNLR